MIICDLVLSNVTLELSNVSIKCEKRIMVPPNVTKVILDVMLVLANVTIKLCEKKIRVLPNVTKVRSFF